MTPEEFVQRYCNGMKPTEYQAVTIRSFLDWYFGIAGGGSTLFFKIGQRQSGKTTLSKWLISFLSDMDHLDSYGVHLVRFQIEGDRLAP
jgi:hypothetical protein